ncbi:MAG TPA: site-2 protease family protein, partial [Bacteroidetes bacterium]|nr:site-2 protease family protein [Bacteroidota bacterium]HEX03575.1 site-2 protease family protein [Bacteroidota bacterium]
LIGLTFHEAAHAFAAWKLGDPTAKQLGRLTLNPLKHLDLFGTLMIFIVHFGWAKPVPVNVANFRHPKRDHLIVALAGPATNFLLAAAFGMLIRIMPNPGSLSGTMIFVYQIVMYGLIINIVLAVFNLLPVPPLDGSSLVHLFFPARYERQYRLFARAAGFLLLAVVVIGMLTKTSILGAIINKPVGLFLKLFAGL